MTCPRCPGTIMDFAGELVCVNCGYRGETRAPTVEERGTYRKREAQLRSNPAPPRALRRNAA